MMIVLNKKKIIFTLGIILVTVFALTIKHESNEETLQTVALPVTNKVIVIDARTWHSRWRSAKQHTVPQKHKQI